MSKDAVTSALGALEQRWSALTPRDRVLVTMAAVVFVAYLVWAVALGPALSTLRRAPAELAALQAQEQQMLALAQATKSLRAVAPVAPGVAAQALQSATARLGAQARLVLQGDRAVLTLQATPAPQLVAWLGEIRAGARARVTEATLTQAGPGAYSGSITLAIGAGS